jgi:hypothetical protein
MFRARLRGPGQQKIHRNICVPLLFTLMERMSVHGSQPKAKPMSAERMNMMKRALYTLALAVGTLFTTAAAHAQVGVAVRVGPAAVYATPCPGPGYVWAPGYYSGAYWVPGRWAYRGYYRPYYHAHYYRPYYGRR